jgi:hypothetical protein
MTTPRWIEDVDRQLPVADETFLDHVGHFVPDPDRAVAALSRAGFLAAPRSIQVNPDGRGGTVLTGTGNVTAMLRRGYIEVLFKTADTPLGRELDLAMARHAGVHLAAFSVAAASAAHARLARSGFRVRPLVEMERPVDTVAGKDRAAFTIARVESGDMTEGRMQFVTHRTEGTVWQPRWLGHPNGATGLVDMVVVTADRAEAAARFSRFLDRPSVAGAIGEMVRLERGGVLITDAATISRLLPEIKSPALPFIGLYAVTVRSLAVLKDVLARNHLPFRHDAGTVTAPFPGDLGIGAWMFVETADYLPWRCD